MRKPYLCHMQTTKAQISMRIRAVSSAPLLLYNISSFYIRNFKLLTSFSVAAQAGVPVYLAPWTACPPGGKPTTVGLPPGGQAVPGYLTPRPGYLNPRGASCPGRFILPPAHIKKILLCDVYYYLQHYNNYMQFLSINMSVWMITSNIQLGFLLTRGGGQAVQGGLSCPPPRISERIDNQQFLLHHLLQKYLVERHINFISVNLRCLLQTLSWVTYWQDVGGKLSRAVYLAPHLEFQREWIIRKFYYTIYYRNI